MVSYMRQKKEEFRNSGTVGNSGKAFGTHQIKRRKPHDRRLHQSLLLIMEEKEKVLSCYKIANQISCQTEKKINLKIEILPAGSDKNH